ncbi:MAG: 5-formyltetrahydrofolate cyclo-ligase [Chromatiales bacterium]|jgi:5-formyltetrahydrofolate cyclo-ligase|nr:MAG: 5-formyltetrahydrofolate cyclo-ligase [Chromatiales bacterium]
MPAPRTSDDPGPKARLRREVRAKRNALPLAQARPAARRAVHRLWSLPYMARAKNVAMYLPIGGELDCTPLVIQAWTRGRKVFLPVISGTRLRFAPFRPGAELRANRFGILEPATHARHLCGARQLDVIVAPLVAFDQQGNRLGMGGGYYDRTLAFLKQRACTRRPYLVAVAFEMQKVEVVPIEEWDVHLDAVVTEKATYRIT